METVSRVHAKNLVRWAQHRPEVLVLSADLTSSTEIDLFREGYPDRFISAGISEQNMVSVAGGLAREGFVPFVHTFAVFLYRRALDQIAMSVAYPNLPVRLFGFLPGITTPGGATHQAIEDLAVMGAIPNMTVVEVGDATELESVLDLSLQVPGPLYMRMLRGQVPRIFPPHQVMELDRPRTLSAGEDITLITSGVCTEEALIATAALTQSGVSVEHLHVSTHKPFRHPSIPEALAKAKHGIITVENHTVAGGLGTLVTQVMVAHGIRKRLITLGIQDRFSHGASKRHLMREHGMDAAAMMQAVETLLVGQPHHLDHGAIDHATATAPAPPMHSDAKPEAL